MNMKVVHSMDELKCFLDDNGWQVLGGHTAWLVVKTSPAGEDVQFTILHNDDVRRAIHEIKLFACEFDIDKHVNKWIEARNNNNYYSTRLGGLPSEKDIAADAVAIKAMLNELADGVKSYEQKSIDETLANAQARSEKHNFDSAPAKSKFYKTSDGFFDYYVNVQTGEKKFKLEENDILVERNMDDFMR